MSAIITISSTESLGSVIVSFADGYWQLIDGDTGFVIHGAEYECMADAVDAAITLMEIED